MREDKKGTVLNYFVKNEKLYKIQNIYDLALTKLDNILLNLCDKNMKFVEKKQKGSFSVYVYQKP